MTENKIETWLKGYELTLEQSVYASLALALAREFDAKPHTSTAAELRKTVQALGAMLNTNDDEYDPLADLLTR